MSYEHLSVASLKASTARAVQSYAETIETTDEATEAARRQTMRMMAEGFPVTIELWTLCEELRKTYRGIKFGLQTRRAQALWRNGFSTPSEVWAYMEGDEYAPIRIGYADYSVRGSKTAFGVYSRTISNEKFRNDRDQHYMIMATTMPRALSAVRKHMRKYNTFEIAAMSMSNFLSSVNTTMWSVRSKSADAAALLTAHKSYWRELKHLIDSGHTFIDPAFEPVVRAAIEGVKESEALDARQHHCYYVHVRDGINGQEVDVIEVTDFRNRHVTKLNECPVTTYTNGDTPEDIVMKVASLSMLDAHKFVDELGYKVNDTTFWVLR